MELSVTQLLLGAAGLHVLLQAGRVGQRRRRAEAGAAVGAGVCRACCGRNTCRLHARTRGCCLGSVVVHRHASQRLAVDDASVVEGHPGGEPWAAEHVSRGEHVAVRSDDDSAAAGRAG